MKAFSETAADFPPVFGRQVVEQLFPGVIRSKQLAELASRGQGPPFRKVGRRVIYERESFLSWLDSQAR